MNFKIAKKVSLPALSAVVCIVLLCSLSQAGVFSVRESGEVQADGQRFADMKEYLQSDYFRQNGKRCGVRTREGVQDGRLAKSTADCTSYLTSIKNEYWPELAFTLPVWWHVISDSNGQGNVTDAAIVAQMAVLNEDYRAKAGTMGSNGFDVNIQFELAGITRTVNDAWFTDSEADEAAYKQALAKDPGSFINIYTNDAEGVLGYAYYPQGSAGAYWDGIVLNHESVGGRNNGFYHYDHGRTLVHEMGHYLGLQHTFNDYSCDNTYATADRIVDTNAENAEHYGCAQTYTCGSADPINNYMDYSDDFCMDRFTREQANRAVCSLVNYRPDLILATADTSGQVIPPLLMLLMLKNEE
jgi:hypothetical protein